MATMRAKLQVGSVQEYKNDDGAVVSESLSFHGVPKNNYDDSGSDEDNTYAKFSPSVSLNITIANPALFGKFKQGDKFYVDFTAAE